MVYLILIGIGILFIVAMGSAIEEDTTSMRIHYHQSKVRTKHEDFPLARYKAGEIGVTTKNFKRLDSGEYVEVKFENKVLLVNIVDLEWLEYC